MSEKKPTPSVRDNKERLCPVCGKRSYSKDSIHPQCAMILADAPRANRLAAERKQKEAAKQEENKSN